MKNYHDFLMLELARYILPLMFLKRIVDDFNVKRNKFVQKYFFSSVASINL